ncbi:Store-operated calcium entry-associated regulatory factor [Nymphon striatum]|nr:Store-operated calcium entry-associated regulatory factor [Nymphon striatum]
MKLSMIGQFLLGFWSLFSAVHGSSKVRLRDINVLTLYSGKMTTYRRTSALSQLNCVGGSANCQYTPQVVQCYNRGSDGFDVQWECKADMDYSYQFGKIEVACEGYDYPEDEYVLKGSCGLEYTLDLTKDGSNRKQQNQHNYYGNERHHAPNLMKSSSGFGDLIILVVVGIIIYAIYKTCLTQYQHSSTNDDDPSHNQGQNGAGAGAGGWFGNTFGGTSGAPPSYGFRQEHYDAGCGGSQPHNRRNNFGGFWTGAATGGFLGYMFGNRNQGATNNGYRPQSSWRSYDNNSAWGGTGGSSSSFSGSSSSGTRSSSGFGGTRRR